MLIVQISNDQSDLSLSGAGEASQSVRSAFIKRGVLKRLSRSKMSTTPPALTGGDEASLI